MCFDVFFLNVLLLVTLCLIIFRPFSTFLQFRRYSLSCCESPSAALKAAETLASTNALLSGERADAGQSSLGKSRVNILIHTFNNHSRVRGYLCNMLNISLT